MRADRQTEASTEQDIALIARERVAMLGEALGLHPDLVRAVQAQGELALISRAEKVDQTGAHARLLAMVQQYGTVMDEALLDERQVSPGEELEVLEMISRHYGVPERFGIELIGAVAEVFQEAAQRIAAAPEEAPTGEGE